MASAVAASKKGNKKKKKPKVPKLSPLHRPEGMELEVWQAQLRREFGRQQNFEIRNVGDGLAFSDFVVVNPASKNSYRVTVRSRDMRDNSCTCPDFQTNALGTCKHLEFALGKLERSRKAAAELKAGHQPARGEVFLRYGAQRKVHFLPAADASPAMRKLSSVYFDANGALKPDKAGQFEEFLETARKQDADLKCGDDVLTFLAEMNDAGERETRVAEAFPQGIDSPAFKDIVKVPLYDYQREGALFAARKGRVLIGDEMGLGKTIQAIAAAEIMARLHGVERVLIVCPTSLKHQWKKEIEKFTERSAAVVEGFLPQRMATYRTAQAFFLIANYDTIHNDLEYIGEWAPDLVILDEAQRIKNWATRVARSVKKIESPYAVVLTGTPLENRIEELISIVQFVDKHHLGPTYKMLDTHQIRDEVGKVTGYQRLNEINQTLAPIMVRRKKDQVLKQLPERIESIVYVPMTELQRQLHDEAREAMTRIVAKWRRFKFLSESDKRKLMASLQTMRMSCDSSYLCDTETNQGLKVGEIMTVLGELLEDPSVKVVLFSQWLGMHELLSWEAKQRGWGHVVFHGGVPGKNRGKLVDEFRDNPACRLFFSTDAGGVGLNLQFASAVINCDLPWNPAVLNQRIGRVHRMGQKQPVRVVNFVARQSIEEGMLGVLEFKSSLSAGVLDGGENEIHLGGSRLTKFIETVEAATANVPPQTEAGERTEREAAREAVGEFAEAAPPTAAPGEEAKTEAAPPTPTPQPVDTWAGLLAVGANLLQQFAAKPAGGATATEERKPLVQRDEKTGENFLRLPVPNEEVVQQALKAFGALLNSLKR